MSTITDAISDIASVLRYKRDFSTTFALRSHLTVWSWYICNYIKTLAWQSWDIRASVSRQSWDILACVRQSPDIWATALWRSGECRSVLFLATKSQNVVIYVAVHPHLYPRIFVALCGSQKQNYDASAKDSRQVGEGFATHAMSWRLFSEDFCRIKFLTCSKLSRTVRDACEDLAIPCERFATVRGCLVNRFVKQSRTRRIPVRKRWSLSAAVIDVFSLISCGSNFNIANANRYVPLNRNIFVQGTFIDVFSKHFSFVYM